MLWNNPLLSRNPQPKPYGHENDTLYVERDWTTQGNGRWRLVWGSPDSDYIMPDESAVTGQPYFRTMRDAVAHGFSKYGIKAQKADW